MDELFARKAWPSKPWSPEHGSPSICNPSMPLSGDKQWRGESPEACGLASLNTTVNITRGAISSTAGRWELSLKAVLCPPLARWGTCIHEHIQHMLVHVCTHSYFTYDDTGETESLISFYGCVIGNINWKVKPVTSLEEKRQGDPLAEISPQNSYRTFVRH